MAFSIFNPQIPWWTDDLYAKPQIVTPIPSRIQEALPTLFPEEISEIRGDYVEIWLTPDALEATIAPSFLVQLPIDVWERIIDCFQIIGHVWNKDHRDALVSCALTCRAWLPRCRYHLYSSGLQIQSEAGLDAVIKAISHTPYLAKRVYSLTVSGGEHYNTALIIRTLLRLGPKLTNLEFLHIYSVDFTHGHIDHFFKALSLFRSRYQLYSFFLSNYRFSRHSQLVRCVSTAGAKEFSLNTGFASLAAHVRHQGSPDAAHLDTLRFRDVSGQSKNIPSSIVLTVSWSELSNLCGRLRFAVSGPQTIVIQALQWDKDDLSQIMPTVVPLVVEMILRFCSLTQHQVSVVFSLPSGGEIELTRSAGGEHP